MESKNMDSVQNPVGENSALREPAGNNEGLQSAMNP